MTKIVCATGRKQAGKNSLANFLLGLSMAEIGIVKGQFATDEKGRLWITDIFGQPAKGIFDPWNPSYPDASAFAEEHIFGYYQVYSFAQKLKGLLIDLFGVTHEQMFGTDEQKNSETKLLWENMPGVCCDESIYTATSKASKWVNANCYYHLPGVMTARDLMQFAGTQVFRKMYGDVWVDACLNQIKKDAPEFAFISDCRFPNEVAGVKAAGGWIFRLTRNGDVPTMHESEYALDQDKYDWSNFDFVLDNQGLTRAEAEVACVDELKRIGWL